MNATRRKSLTKILDTLDQAKSDLESLLSEEQKDFDNRSEKWQEGEAGQEAQEKLDALQTAIDSLDDICGGDARSIADAA